MVLRVLTLSTLFPDQTRPNFGVFVERQTRELAGREGTDVTVIAPIGIAPWPLSALAPYRTLRALPDKEQWQRMTVYRPRFPLIPKIGGRFHVRMMTRAILPLVRRLHEQQPFDVIDASFFYPDGPVAANIARALAIPFSVKARGADIHYWGRTPATRSAVLRAGREATGLLAVSEAMKRSMVALGMDADKIDVHYTGVDLDRFIPTDRPAAKAARHLSGPVVLCVGALIERKGQELLIRALPQLPDVTLLLAGAGPEATHYTRLAEDLGVSTRVGMLGAVAHAELPALFNAADIMALPSASEGLANAWVEALACGTPIVISDVGGARELVTNDTAGRIVERTPDAIAEAIRALLLSPPDREATRSAALRFTWQANGDALFAHLTKLAGKPL
ncbi:glycosyltransferase [Sphingobium subterraneum]|uniref:Glycosyltransferase involved in cell wall biosynthesis n=1 Tax=Sphingobium subterraneum TaxID=627688 RepID=A0A841J351_9SPHN|nr:glycosyltransferase [Sphingobium subterraneum]MBB6122721.1 glycosyltransferase involved in cell wall biosynthesis [Sphingobium subterraneum]